MKNLIFIHGFLLSGWIFYRMERYFEARGYQCLRFNYPTRTQTIAQSADFLCQWVMDKQINSADFICHSMGGLVCHTYFQRYKVSGKWSHVVCLGSPLNGSVVAQNLTHRKLGAKLLGVQANSQLAKGVSIWPDNSQLGVIAGKKNMGKGRLLGVPANQQGDGTILVNETRIEGASDHIILPVTHTQMTFSNLVAQQAEYFIKHQRFNHYYD